MKVYIKTSRIFITRALKNIYYFVYKIFRHRISCYYSLTVGDPIPIEQRLLTALILLGVYVFTQISKWFEQRIDRATYLSAIFLVIQLFYVSYLMGYDQRKAFYILIFLTIVNLTFKGDRFALYANILLFSLLALSMYFAVKSIQSRLSFLIDYLSSSTVGSATKTKNDQDITEIIKQADKIMYKNKTSYRK